MKNILTKITFVALLLITAISCDGKFEETNTNYNDPITVSPNLLLGQVVRTTGNVMYSTGYGGNMGSCWSQQLSKVQYNDEERYNPRQSAVTGLWELFYQDIAADAKNMYALAEAEGNNNLMGIALVLQAHAFNVLTDVYGDIPFSEALQAENGIISPKYDAQSAVYNGIFAMLDQASALLGTGGDVVAATDLMYGGDVMKWKKFANSLKFRGLMRISSKVDVSSQLQALMDAGHMFASNTDEAKLVYLDEDPNANPIYESVVFGTRGEWKVCETFVNQLANTADPRISQMVGLNEDGVYRGKPSGVADVPSDAYNYTNVSAIGNFFLKPQAPAYFMSYSELQFLIAEAIVKSYVAGDASIYYNEGINASFMATETAADPAGFQGAVALTADMESNLEKIATQNWVGMFCQGLESWIEQKRTGYPVLPVALDPYIDEIPSRLNYPNIEASINAENYATAVQAQGADLLTTKLWWMQ